MKKKPALFNITSKPVEFSANHYFGHCRFSTHENYYLNIYRAHWMLCDKCRIKWLIGENLFSSWRKQNQGIWETNAMRIREYREVQI